VLDIARSYVRLGATRWNMRRLERHIGIRFSSVEADRIAALAQREDRSVSNVIRVLVREALARREEREPQRPEA
jgi:hypothetical protein